jgi:hypothetical protein
MTQKEFKTTPVYVEISEHDEEEGYHMGVYLCLGQHHHGLSHDDAIPFSYFKNFNSIQNYIAENEKVYVFFGDSKHKIKKKAEQAACKKAIGLIKK